MNLVFKAAMLKEWSVTDDTLYVGRNNYPLSAITFIKNSPSIMPLTNGVMQIQINGQQLLTLAYARSQNTLAVEAFEFIKKKLELKDCIKDGKTYVENKEYRMLCLACGKRFFYTTKDLKDNQERAKRAMLSTVGSSVNALAGSSIVASTESGNADRLISQIRDFSKCPYCNSTSIREMTEDEWDNRNTNLQNAFSSADELKKFKELLDSGVITQEEFDAKKKQLLGL